MGVEMPPPSLSSSSLLRSKPFLAVVTLIFCITFFFKAPLPSQLDEHRSSLLKFGDGDRHPAASKSKYAYATFLTGTVADAEDADFNHDNYFIAARLLCYQLLHSPETRTNQSIPFLAIVTQDVPQSKQDRLAEDGAIVIPVDYIREDWVHAMHGQWADVLTKLRMWELTQYERILFLDTDTIVTRPLDGIFQDPAASLDPTKPNKDMVAEDESPQPTSYAFAGVPEMNHDHHYPPSDENHDFPNINYLNAGFFVFSPSVEIFNHYLSIIRIRDRFNPDFPEQNLLNYAHRREGNMPWKQLAPTWNIHYPNLADLEGGVASLHDKWWAPEHPELEPFLRSLRWRMEGFYEGVDSMKSVGTIKASPPQKQPSSS
jgi:alpha-N-acetylglucosamine transferase